ncbi:MBL fold metallo-hydrolase [Granulosicoccus sp.]|nr:MBL fold metallo-hydrolase [Granulosicoccus sp.]MDB4224676.1 MBL fold metallo-hydrolase [Granulosicoccus sp.]
MTKPEVTAFFDEGTKTVSYVVTDPSTKACAVVDSLLDYEPASGRTHTTSVDVLIAFVREAELRVEWIIDTHVHADHLTAAPYVKAQLGGRTAIGEHIVEVQQVFAEVFNEGQSFHTNGAQFDHLFKDGEEYLVGNIQARAIHTPGHTPACMVHLMGDAAFVGDTLFMPDFGTARCDFPGGDARQLYQSIQKIYQLPATTRLFTCHDYKAPGREEFAWESTVIEQMTNNVQTHQGISENEFVAMRDARDAKLGMPELIIPSVQVNMRAGNMPEPENNGKRYLKIPLNTL